MHTRAGLLSLLIGITLTACSDHSEQKSEATALTLPVIQLTEQDATLDHFYTGELEAVQNVEVRARVAGYLDKILIDEGRPVRKGQLLFQLNPTEYQVEVDRGQASLESAMAEEQSAAVELERVKLLVGKNVISPSELKLAKAKMETARSAINAAKAALTKARFHVSLTSIRAPFDGVINRIPFKRGSLIEEGALLTSISDLREMYAYFHVSEKEYLAFIKKRRDPDKTTVREVDLLLADDTPYPFKGKIETTETEFEGNSGTIAFRASFPNPNRLLRHGATGKIRLATEVDDAVLVPQKAVFEVQDKNFVYVVDAKNRVRTRSFVPRSRVDQMYVVQSGLKAGDRIVYEGIQSLKDGMTIIPKALPAKHLQALYASAH
ncbi:MULTISPECIES: efflux RND transporter periplasmic adaptor subunit [unclassified Spirosoma]|uniref:efflux RND transporter periplasmic adaptor subunit n=1 Tax=unclassified Spirosoma TaxID=2621999 RepID=UPI00095E6AA5|nr:MULTISPECIES: efflux RND transporter periplasmic adaptor subunit [unclassified Spirosoma]MBN8821343.1 efflux RND transporter periplasmic adaptor subunit [Spirosoma sp.]OJW78133.1 MAG: efflux transporter periplasmic adaptor subunit [Spirosoma sp. 48-14]